MHFFFHIPNRTMRLSKKNLYHYFAVFLPCLGQFLLWKHFIYMSLHIKNKKNRDLEGDSPFQIPEKTKRKLKALKD